MESYSSVLGIDVSASHNTRNEVSPTLLPPDSKWGPKRQGGTEAGFCSGQLANPFFYYLFINSKRRTTIIYLFIYLLINSKRRTRDDIGPLLNEDDHLTNRDIDKAEKFNAFIASAFNTDEDSVEDSSGIPGALS